MKTITFSADDALIEQARRQAALENTTLNELFCCTPARSSVSWRASPTRCKAPTPHCALPNSIIVVQFYPPDVPLEEAGPQLIDGNVTAEHAQELEDASWRHLPDLQPLREDMLCFIQISLQLHQVEQVMHFRTAIQQLPEVLECHHVTGEYDYLLKVVVRNRQELERLVMEKLTPLPGVARIHTSLVFSEIKASTALPLR
jgi:DNA-binding Lrp family transcriptional regulator